MVYACDNTSQIHIFEYLSLAVCRPDDLFSLLGQVCPAVEDDGSLAVACVVIGTEEIVPTEA